MLIQIISLMSTNIFCNMQLSLSFKAIPFELPYQRPKGNDKTKCYYYSIIMQTRGIARDRSSEDGGGLGAGGGALKSSSHPYYVCFGPGQKTKKTKKQKTKKIQSERCLGDTFVHTCHPSCSLTFSSTAVHERQQHCWRYW